MLELKITAKMLDVAEPEIIGIKEALSNLIEKWADVVYIDVKPSPPLQLKIIENKTTVREKLTVSKALEEIEKASLTVEEMQNIISAIIEINKIEGTESNDIQRIY